MRYSENTRVKAGVYSARIKTIIEIVAEFYGLKPSDICKHTSDRRIIFARQLAQYLAYRRLQSGGCSLAAVGVVTGNGKAYDHVTVRHSIKVVSNYKYTKRNGHPVYPEQYADIMQLESRVFRTVSGGVEDDMESFAQHHGDFLN